MLYAWNLHNMINKCDSSFFREELYAGEDNAVSTWQMPCLGHGALTLITRTEQMNRVWWGHTPRGHWTASGFKTPGAPATSPTSTCPIPPLWSLPLKVWKVLKTPLLSFLLIKRARTHTHTHTHKRTSPGFCVLYFCSRVCLYLFRNYIIKKNNIK